MIGETLGHYRIESRLGQGGMGIVYRAIDTRLRRKVAIKVLPSEAVADPDRKKRFIREARSASALNHPNIVTIHEIDTAETAGRRVDFLAMEYVDGKTLDQMAVRKRLPFSDALKIAVQVADALSAAHAAGLIHRDIKPGNIMVSDKGFVKVLDFGLAKLVEPASDASAATRSIDAEEDARTEEGTVVGTVAYMSPEQAQGKPLDGRSDIFSFGSVLYELLTGRRPFQGENKMATLSRILTHEPAAISQFGDDIPPELERIVARCLRKDPSRRFQHVEDLKIALQELKEESESGRLSVGRPAHLKSRRHVPVVLAGAVALVTAISGVVWFANPPEPSARGVTLVRLTSDSGLSFMPALSPDGKLLAYASDRSGDGNFDIWVKQVAGGEPVRLTRQPTPDLEPAFSPDSTRIAFRSERDGRGIYIVSALGGDERRVADQGYEPRWSPDGQWISYGINTPASNFIYAVPSAGGAPKRLRPEFAHARPPLWLPDGQRILFHGSRDGKQTDWWVAHFEGGNAIQIGAYPVFRRLQLKNLVEFPFGIGNAGWPSAWLDERNQVVFSAGLGDSANLWGLPISPQTWQAAGDPEQLTFGSGSEIGPSVARPGSSPGRLLAFANVVSNIDIWSLAMNHPLAKTVGDIRRLTRDAAADTSPSVSLDGQRLAFISHRSGNDDVWLRELVSGRETPVTTSSTVEFVPVIARDGLNVAYTSYARTAQVGDAQIHVVRISKDGQPGVPQRVCDNCGDTSDWFVDGRKILYRGRTGERFSLVLLDLDSRETKELLQSDSRLANGRFSPDGEWVLFEERFGARDVRLWVARLKGLSPTPRSEWILVAESPLVDRQACWGPDGNLVYFTSERDTFGCIWAQRMDPRTKRPTGAAFPVHHFHGSVGMRSSDVRDFGLNAVRDKLVFSLTESSGNIWMTSITAQDHGKSP